MYTLGLIPRSPPTSLSRAIWNTVTQGGGGARNKADLDTLYTIIWVIHMCYTDASVCIHMGLTTVIQYRRANVVLLPGLRFLLLAVPVRKLMWKLVNI